LRREEETFEESLTDLLLYLRVRRGEEEGGVSFLLTFS
jgi:hypothetical protein